MPTVPVFNSTANVSVNRFLRKLGCETSTNAYGLHGTTPLTNMLLGIKYSIYDREYTESDTRRLVASENSTYLYENRNSLSLGFMLPESFTNAAIFENDFPASDSRIVGIADCDPNNLGYGGEAGLLCFSIPYDEGWHVMVDGVETETMRVFGGALVGVSVPKGTHTITLEYWPLGLTTGITVSIFSLILLLFLVKPGCRKKRLPDPV